MNTYSRTINGTRYRAGVVVVVAVALVPLIACGERDRVPAEVRAQAFVLTDSTGREVKGRFAVNDSGLPILRFSRGDEDSVRVVLRPDGLQFFDRSGRRFGLTVVDGGSAHLTIFDEEYPRAKLDVFDEYSWFSLHGPDRDGDHFVRVPADASDVKLPPSVQIPEPPRH